MGFFDWYLPRGPLSCPRCGVPLLAWQGKEGPCGMFVWKEGVAHPIEQQVSDDVALLPAERLALRLPERARIYSYDCAHGPIDAECVSEDGVWQHTTLLES